MAGVKACRPGKYQPFWKATTPSTHESGIIGTYFEAAISASIEYLAEAPGLMAGLSLVDQ